MQTADRQTNREAEDNEEVFPEFSDLFSFFSNFDFDFDDSFPLDLVDIDLVSDFDFNFGCFC